MLHEADMIPSLEKLPVQEASNQTSNNSQWWVSWQGKYKGIGIWSRQNIQVWVVNALPSFFWKNSSARIDPRGNWTTGIRARGHGCGLTLLQFAAQGHFWGPVVLLLASVWEHMDTWPPPIFIPEGTKVQFHMMQLADFIPRDRSTKSLNDLPKDIYWVNSRNGNKTQSPDAGASSPSLDTSPNRENNLLKYWIALAFWWVSKLRSKSWEKWVLNFLWHNPFGKYSSGCKKNVTYVINESRNL